jgi:cytochrome c oxidase assembly protein subunit 15
METSLPLARRWAVSARTFRRLTLVNVGMLIVIVATGATVRLTRSGLGCEHWPGCQPGAFLPAKGYHSYVEFTNRAIAGVAVFVAVATLFASLLTPVRRAVRWTAGIAAAGTVAQAPLGAITVHYHLNPWLVLAHFLLSIVVLGLAVVVALEAWDVRGPLEPQPLRRLAAVALAACGVLVVTGTLATAAGPHSGSVVVPRVWSLDPALWLHVRATAVFALSFAAVLVWLWRRQSPNLRPALAVLALLAGQMVVGEIQYRTKLPWWLVLVHVTLAAAVWTAAVAFVGRLWRPSRIA